MLISSLIDIYRITKKIETADRPSFLSVLADIYRLRQPPNKISQHDYFSMQLYRRDKETKNKFLGSSLECGMNYVVASPFWFSTIRDKILCHNILVNGGIETPRIVAAYSASRQCPSIPTFSTQAELEQALRGNLPYPVFGKASGGDFGIGARYIDRYDPTDDTLVDPYGARETVVEAASDICGQRFGAYLFQEVARNSPEHEALVGPGLSTLRVLVLNDDENPVIHRAFLKICRTGNINDNWDLGKHGNPICPLDEATGRIQTIIAGELPNISFTEHHPDSGEELAGRCIPDWSAVKALCASFPKLFPGIRMLHADIAITPTGPSIIEINEDGSIIALQGVGYRGFLDSRFTDFYAKYGHDLASPATQALISKMGSAVNVMFGADNAYRGRGSFYEMINTMK
jgi:hypothetical protein